MANIVSWIPKPSNRIVMYEVLGENDKSEFGSESANEVIAWLSRNPLNKRVVVTNWFADDEDAAPVGESVDITSIIFAAIAQGRGRA